MHVAGAQSVGTLAKTGDALRSLFGMSKRQQQQQQEMEDWELEGEEGPPDRSWLVPAIDFINNGVPGNVKHEQTKRGVVVKATRAIAAGEELLLEYNTYIHRPDGAHSGGSSRGAALLLRRSLSTTDRCATRSWALPQCRSCPMDSSRCAPPCP